MSAELLQALLKLSVQGVFCCSADLVVHEPVSDECERIFGRDIRGEDVVKLLFGSEVGGSDFRDGLGLVFKGLAMPEVIFDLIEKEIVYQGRRLRLDLEFLDKASLLVVLSDVTRERRFQELSRRDVERRFAVLKAVAHQRYFAAFVREALLLFDQLYPFEDKAATSQELSKLSRSIHTFKGNAGFFDFAGTVARCQRFEEELDEMRVLEGKNCIKPASLELKQAFFAELRGITDLLGPRWLPEADGVSISRKHFARLEAWVAREHPDDIKLRNTLAWFRREPFRELFVRFPSQAEALAVRLGKRLHPLIVEGGDFPVLPERYAGLANCLVHLLRNAIDHGIEPPFERKAAGKAPEGSLSLVLSRSRGLVRISLGDDGRGIDGSAVRQEAERQGLETGGHSDAEHMQILFHQGFSTKSAPTEISGRGLGLAAVKAEVERLRGSIQVHSRLGKGTTFEISIPESTSGYEEDES